MKNELNTIIKVFIYLVIARHAINIPQQLIRMTTSIYDNTICLVTLGLSISMIIILYHMLKVKRWAIISFFTLQYINALTIGVIEGKGDYLTHIIVSTIFCGLIAALLFLKKDETSGWRMFFGRGDERNVISNNETLCEIQPLNDSDTLSENTVIDNTEKSILNNPTEEKKEVDNKNQLNNIENTIASIPKKEDGSINYEAMDIYQQFEYTSVTESKEVAIKDLKKEISIKEKERKELDRELSLLTGGKRAEQRDIIRRKENEIQELKNLLSGASKEQIAKRKLILLICVIFAVVASIPSYIIYSNHLKQQEIAIHKQKVCNDKNIRIIHNTLKKEGYTPPEYDAFKKDMQDDKNLQGVYNTLKKEGYTPPEYNVFKQDMLGSEKLQDIYNTYKDDLSTLYSALIGKGYSKQDLGDENTFRNKMSDKGHRKELYDYVAGRGDFKIGEYDKYESRLSAVIGRRWTFDILVKMNYDLGGFNSFLRNMEDKNKRKEIYRTLVKENCNVGTFEEFETGLGYILK